MGRGKKAKKNKKKKATQSVSNEKSPRHAKDQLSKREKKRNQKRKQGKGNLEVYSGSFRKFTQQLERLGLHIRDMRGDGNCMFRAVADQLYSQEHRHDEVRRELCDFVESKRTDFEPFVEDDEDFDIYLARMRTDAEWGGNFELAAVVRCFGVHVIVHQLAAPRYQLTNHEIKGSHVRTIHLSYHDGEHYNSVRVLGDNSSIGPAVDISTVSRLNVPTEKENSTGKESRPSDVTVVSRATGNADLKSVEQVLYDCEGDVDAAIEVLMAEQSLDPAKDSTLDAVKTPLGSMEEDRKTAQKEHGYVDSDTQALENTETWDTAVFKVKPVKRVTRKERKAEAKRLREAKREKQQARRRQEEAKKEANKLGRRKKLTKQEKREEQRRRRQMSSKGVEMDCSDVVSGEGVVLDNLETLAI